MRKTTLSVIALLMLAMILTLTPWHGALAAVPETTYNTELVVNGGAESGAAGNILPWVDETGQSRWSSYDGVSLSWPAAPEGSRSFSLYNPSMPNVLTGSMSQWITLHGMEGSGLYASISAGNVSLQFSLRMYQALGTDNEVKAIIEQCSTSGNLLTTSNVVCTSAGTRTFGNYTINTQLNPDTRKIKVIMDASLTTGGYAEYDAISLKLVDASSGSAPVFGGDFPTEGTTKTNVVYTHGFTITDADAGDTDRLSFSVNSDNVNLVPAARVIVRGTGSSREILITPVNDLSGEANITVTASDGSKSTDATLHLVVSKVINLGANLVENGNATSGFASWQGDQVNVTASGNGFVVSSPGNGMYQKLDISMFSAVIDVNMTDFEFKASDILGGSGEIKLQFYSDIACTTAVGDALTNTNNTTRSGTIPAGAMAAIVSFTSTDGGYHPITFRNISFVILNTFPIIDRVFTQAATLTLLSVPVKVYYTTDTISLTATSSDQTVVANADITTDGSGFFRTVKLTPRKEGSTTITVTANDGSNTKTRTFTVNVHEPTTVTGVTMPAAGYYAAGGTLDFTVNFSRDILGGSTSTLPLTIGTAAADATYLSATVTSITYRYTVGSDDEGTVALGTAIGNATSPITDASGFDADVSFTADATGVTVVPTPTVTSAAAGDTAVYGTQVSFTMSLTCADLLAGDVQFYADGVSIGDSATLSGNNAYYTTDATALDAGTPEITATFTPSGTNCHFTDLPSSAYSLTITPQTVTVSDLVATDRQYDGSNAVALSGGSLSGVLAGDTVTATYPVSGTAASVNVGTHDVTFAAVTLGGTDGGNYAITEQPTVSVSITAKPITFTAAVANKVYDGTTDGTVSSVTFSDLVTGEALTSGVDYTATAVFDSASIADNVPATVTVTLLTTTKAGNYALSAATYETDADITRKLLTITDVTATDRDYNGDTAVTLSGGKLVGVEGGDEDSIGFTLGDGATLDANAATAKAVTTNITLTGDAADDYSLTQPSDVTVDIAKLPLTLDSAAASDKAYDGNATATVTDVELSGEITGETLVFGTDYTATGLFDDADVGEDKTVTVTVTLAATALTANYTLPDNTITTDASITNSGVTLTGVSATDRAYDGTVSVALTGGSLVGIAAEDAAAVGFTLGNGTMDCANVGNGKAVTTAIVLTGAKAGNYTLTQPESITVDIAKAELTVDSATVSDKDYDASTEATVTDVTFGGLVTGESLTAGVDYTASAVFDSADAAADIPVTVTVTLNGTPLADNYTVIGTGAATASIARLDLSGTVVIDITNGSGDASLTDGGDTLRANTDGISLPGALTVTYQWCRDDAELFGETADSHTVGDLTADPVGTAFTVKVTGTDNYQGTLTSEAVTVIQHSLGGSVSITGDTKLSDVLTLHTSAVTPAGATYDISWQREGVDIADASDVNYTITKPDQNKKLTATVTGNGYFTGSLSVDIDIPPSPYVPDEAIVELTTMVTVDLTAGPTLLSQEQLDALLVQNATKPIVFGGEGYTITFPVGAMLNWEGELNLGLHFNSGTGYAILTGATGSSFVLMYEFVHSGPLPGTADIAINVGIKYAGQTLRYLYYNPVTGKVELLQTVLVDADGWVTVKQDHCSSYALARLDRYGVPQTGDRTPLVLWWALAGVCTVGLLAMLVWRLRRKTR